MFGKLGFEFLVMSVLEGYFGCCAINDVLIFFRYGCMNILELVLKFWEMLVTCIQGFFIAA